jgi:Predicted thioesterase involved in non-ribosomal peptide biosynthesis
MRLFCFPFAGGSAAFYHNWAQVLPDTVEVSGVELPGRGMRFNAPLHRHLPAIVDPLAAALKPLCDRPFVIFGHSMGSLLGFETARRLQAAGVVPAAFLASGRRGPGIRREGTPLHQLNDEALVHQLNLYNGTPTEILTDPDMLALFLPIIRADLQVNETHTHLEAPKLQCPIHAFAGTDDEEAPPHLVSHWRRQTQGDFSLTAISGGHFFLKENEGEFFRHLLDVLWHIESTPPSVTPHSPRFGETFP